MSLSPELNAGKRMEIVVQQQSRITDHVPAQWKQEKLIDITFTVQAEFYSLPTYLFIIEVVVFNLLSSVF